MQHKARFGGRVGPEVLDLPRPERLVAAAGSEGGADANIGLAELPTKPSVSEKLDALVRPELAARLRLKSPPSFSVVVSRTDAGVHARGNLLTFNLKLPGADPGQDGRSGVGFPQLDMPGLVRAVNAGLPQDIQVRSFAWAPSVQFPAQALRGKQYRYTVVQRAPVHLDADTDGSVRNCVSGLRFAWDVGDDVPLTIGPMREAAAVLTGTHDFAMLATNKPPRKSSKGSARRAGGAERTTIRTITALTVEAPRFVCFAEVAAAAPAGCVLANGTVERDPTCPECGRPCDRVDVIVQFVVEGDGFLTHQVRRIAGLLVEIGRARWPVDFAAQLLRGNGTKPPRAPAHGLCLWQLNLDDKA